MRIASLVPSATEALFALGFGDEVVAVTHECDWPEAANELPRLTSSVIEPGLAPAEIDAAIRELTGRGAAIYALDQRVLERLAPDLIVTQAVCAVCAVSYEDVVAVAARLDGPPRVLQQDPSTLGEMLEDVIRLGEAAGIEPAAHGLRGELEGRLAAVRAAVAGAPRPRVIALEWLEPPYVGGHWLPEMVAIAGGEDVAGPPGLKSPEVGWGPLAALNPDVVVSMPCGWHAERARAETLAHWDRVEALGAGRVFAVDAAATFSRPGPRLIDGVELLGHLLHPDLVDAPGSIDFAELRSG